MVINRTVQLVYLELGYSKVFLSLGQNCYQIPANFDHHNKIGYNEFTDIVN